MLNEQITGFSFHNYPDFSELGYEVIRELGRNQEAGRITYLANALYSDQQVVIKQFRFASEDVDWSGLKTYEREIEVLQQLDHPRIPCYLDCFETSESFCLVQEYKKAPSLAEKHSFNPEEIKQIAVSVLEILVYLQTRPLAIIHRDIKPENILVDEQLNAYLVDFGLARIRGEEVGVSSFAAGTPGFMPPEEERCDFLTEASDLYSLGATLICLLTDTRSVNISKLISDRRFDFQQLVPQLSPCFVDWLTKMVEPKQKHRIHNASLALETLKPIRVIGTATPIETALAAIKRGKLAVVIGLASIGIIAATSSLMINKQGDLLRQSRNQIKAKLEIILKFK
ncbi:serine/threonine protein kinase [Tolypothrix sp. NIES-4075]|uniref:serine/threonine protein kinase n=1 Tax=Tolypothrix sp. NIES-4075 TaxID=2005459 RepID=UPI000B5C347E|nr:protein kinase [Tolypothrix sp. NIES-4075]GAX43044.1 serine/threonine protein kinase [Tolypothrix sp. NIES-4075]